MPRATSSSRCDPCPRSTTGTSISTDKPKTPKPAPARANTRPSSKRLARRSSRSRTFGATTTTPPVENIKMRESIYLFKSGFRPIWEDRRNINGGSWTFRVPKAIGPDFWTRIQLLAIGEKLQSVIDEADQICGVGLSVRFNSHLVTVWHRDSSKQNSVDALIACILEDLPAELQPKPDNYFYKKHSDHAGFKAPPELQAVLDTQKRNAAVAAAANAAAAAESSSPAASASAPAVTIASPQ
ncbi:uncharacterized protein TrAtP1_011140 [Trichoderma atroviride]|uniref:uncharacterized protein n=1 Tax=Hypocrea atroviridis TaxID=63577 RepID=UPI003321EE1B|nr:hypothetical protein TrAtP1_011140 [Trichoderma atroviride]